MQNCTLQAKDLVKFQFPLSNIQRARKTGRKEGREGGRREEALYFFYKYEC